MQEQIEQFLRQSHLPPITWNFIIVGGAILLGLIIKIILHLFLKGEAKQTHEYSLLHSALQHLGKPFNYFIPLFILNACLPLIRMDEVFLDRFAKLIEIALIINFAWILIRCISIAETYVYYKYDFHRAADNLRQRKIRTQLVYIRQVVTGLIILIAIAAVLLSFSSLRKIGAGLLTGVGVGGIIIGFAAQKSLGNLLAGFQIAFTQPIRIDDAVVVEGQFGRIEEITLTYVVVKIWDERRLILPINYFIEKPFENWTRTTSEILGTVFLYTDYTIPIQPLRNEFTRLLNSSSLWDGKANGLVVTDANENTIQIRALMSARNSGDAFDLRCYVREGLINFIKENYPDSLPKTRAEINRLPVSQTV